MLFKSDFLAARNLGQSFVNVGLRPRHIVAFLERTLGDAFGNELSRRLFDRSKIAARHAGFEPCYVIGMKCDRHEVLYHKSAWAGERKPAAISPRQSAPEKPLVFKSDADDA
jgi:hypothetical protein